MKKNYLITLLLLLVIVSTSVLLFSCARDTQQIQDTITIGTISTIEKATRDEYNYDLISASTTQMALISLNTDGVFEPQLATFETSDSKTWKFTVIDNMKWHDGNVVTADDILYTLQYQDKYENGYNLTDHTDTSGKVTTARYESATVSSDKKSITLVLKTANVRELNNLLALRIMPKHIYDGRESSVTDDESRIGCGPYKFESFNKDSGTITFIKADTYPVSYNVSKIVYSIFNNEDSMYFALANGEIDFTWKYSGGISNTAADTLKNNQNITINSYASTNCPAVLTFNNSKGIFTDLNLRKAVSYALDYNEFKNLFGSSYAEVPNSSFVPSSTIGYYPTNKLSTNIDESIKYINAAGYTQKDSEGYYVKDGNRLSFKLTVNSTKADHVRYAELVKNNLKNVGIEVILDAIDTTAYNKKTSNKFSENNITMEAAIFGYTAFGMSSTAGFGTIYMDKNHAVQGGAQVSDPTFSNALSALNSSKTLEEYNEAAKTLQTYYSENLPAIALFWDSTVVAYNSKFNNIHYDATFGITNYNTWHSLSVK